MTIGRSMALGCWCTGLQRGSGVSAGRDQSQRSVWAIGAEATDLHAVRMGRNAAAGRRVDDHLELPPAKDGVRRVGAWRAHAARRHHLDQVDAALELLRHHRAHLRLALHLAAPLVAVAARLGERPPRAQQPRADARALRE